MRLQRIEGVKDAWFQGRKVVLPAEHHSSLQRSKARTLPACRAPQELCVLVKAMTTSFNQTGVARLT